LKVNALASRAQEKNSHRFGDMPKKQIDLCFPIFKFIYFPLFPRRDVGPGRRPSEESRHTEVAAQLKTTTSWFVVVRGFGS
jgi:hypothetical protein